MRQPACALVLDHLGGEQLTSAAYQDNPASLAVSRKVGYVDNGVERRQRREGELAVLRRRVLTATPSSADRTQSGSRASRGSGARSASTVKGGANQTRPQWAESTGHRTRAASRTVTGIPLRLAS